MFQEMSLCLCVQDFIQTLQRVGPPMGFRVGEPYALELQNDRTDTILRTITKNLTKDTQMVSWKYKLGTWKKDNTHKQDTRGIDQLKMNHHHLVYGYCHRKVLWSNMNSLTNDILGTHAQ